MDGFWILRCLKKRIDLPDKIGSFLSGASTPMVVKNGTKKLFQRPGSRHLLLTPLIKLLLTERGLSPWLALQVYRCKSAVGIMHNTNGLTVVFIGNL